jgi:hypothetical protein
VARYMGEAFGGVGGAGQQSEDAGTGEVLSGRQLLGGGAHCNSQHSIGSRHYLGSRLGGAQGDRLGAGCDNSPEAGAMAVNGAVEAYDAGRRGGRDGDGSNEVAMAFSSSFRRGIR